MSEMSPEYSPGDEVNWSLMQPGDQAVFTECHRADCPTDQPPSHVHLDHILHQEPNVIIGMPQGE